MPKNQPAHVDLSEGHHTVEVVHFSTRGSASFFPDFGEITKLIRKEADKDHVLLPVTSKMLETRFNQGDSVVLGVDGQTAGHLSFTRLLDSNMKKKLGLKPNFPEVIELGSAIVAPQFRQNRCSEKMLDSLLWTHHTELQNHAENSIVGVGTTKSLYFVKAVSHISDHLNLKIEFVNHLAYPFLAPLTCVCTPGRGGGMGFQYGEPCNVRIDNAEVLEAFNGRIVPVQGEAICQCVMFVLNPILAESVNNGLGKLVGGSPEAFVKLLIDNNYYPPIPIRA